MFQNECQSKYSKKIEYRYIKSVNYILGNFFDWNAEKIKWSDQKLTEI